MNKKKPMWHHKQTIVYTEVRAVALLGTACSTWTEGELYDRWQGDDVLAGVRWCSCDILTRVRWRSDDVLAGVRLQSWERLMGVRWQGWDRHARVR